MSDLCSIDCVIKSACSDRLKEIKAVLDGQIIQSNGAATFFYPRVEGYGDHYIIHDCTISTGEDNGVNTILLTGWVDWALDSEEAEAFVKYINSKVPITDSDVVIHLFYDELGSDQFGMYEFAQNKLTDNYLLPETIDALREIRDSYEGDEDAAWEAYYEALNKELHGDTPFREVICTFESAKGNKPPENKCPKCGSDALDWEPLESDYIGDGGTVWWPTECLNCKHRFNQLYRLTFTGIESRE